MLISALTEQAESVLVCENNRGTRIKTLESGKRNSGWIDTALATCGGWVNWAGTRERYRDIYGGWRRFEGDQGPASHRNGCVSCATARQGEISRLELEGGGLWRKGSAFRNAASVEPRALNVLLVDAEACVEAGVLDHLTKRDGWHFNATPEGVVHLMAQTMEAWIVADRAALRRFYGQNFQANALPNAQDLETVAKSDLFMALARATENTQKGAYHKINHGSKVLELIDATEVRRRCPHCDRLFVTLDGLIP